MAATLPGEELFFSTIRAVWLLNGLTVVARVVLDEQSRLIPELIVDDLATVGTFV